MTENDRLTTPPVFIVDVDVSSVFFSDGDVWHNDFLSVEITGEMCRSRGRISPTRSSSCHVAFQRYVCASDASPNAAGRRYAARVMPARMSPRSKLPL